MLPLSSPIPPVTWPSASWGYGVNLTGGRSSIESSVGLSKIAVMEQGYDSNWDLSGHLKHGNMSLGRTLENQQVLTMRHELLLTTKP